MRRKLFHNRSLEFDIHSEINHPLQRVGTDCYLWILALVSGPSGHIQRLGKNAEPLQPKPARPPRGKVIRYLHILQAQLIAWSDPERRFRVIVGIADGQAGICCRCSRLGRPAVKNGRIGLLETTEPKETTVNGTIAKINFPVFYALQERTDM